MAVNNQPWLWPILPDYTHSSTVSGAMHLFCLFRNWQFPLRSRKGGLSTLNGDSIALNGTAHAETEAAIAKI